MTGNKSRTSKCNDSDCTSSQNNPHQINVTARAQTCIMDKKKRQAGTKLKQKKKKRQSRAIKKKPSDRVDEPCVTSVKCWPCRTVTTNVPYNWVNVPIQEQRGHFVFFCVCVYIYPLPSTNLLSLQSLSSAPPCILNEYFNDYLSILNEYLSANPWVTSTALIFLKKPFKRHAKHF